MTVTTPPAASLHRNPLVLLGLAVGVVMAPLCARADMPAPAVYNHLLAFLGFGLLLLGLSLARALRAGWRVDGVSLLLLLVALTALSAPWLNGLPWSVAWSGAAMVVTALLIVQAARALRPSLQEALWTLFCLALVTAGLLSVIVAVVQVFAPSWPDNIWIAQTLTGEGRAVGNMRQANQLATVFLWGTVAAVWLARGGWLERRLGSRRRASVAVILLTTLFAAGVMLTASRTGLAGLVMLALWGLVDALLARFGKSRLQRSQRVALVLMPAVWWVCLRLVDWWTRSHTMAFMTNARVEGEGAASPERVLILRNTMDLIRDYPWFGSGWADYNFAWTLTPFPSRFNTAWVDNAHNIFFQLLAEMGLPLGVLAAVLLLAGVGWAAWRGFSEREGAGACAVMIVLVVGLHSLTEFPLWSAYFLFPTALAYGLCLAMGRSRVSEPAAGAAAPQAEVGLQRRDLGLAGLLILLLVPFALREYRNIVEIYAPPPGAPGLIERMALGQSAVFFDLHADYAIATMLPPGPVALAAAQRAGHHLIDARLMVAWAKSLNAVGQTDKARYLAERLKEFKHPLREAFFAECQQARDKGEDMPFQCTPPQRSYSFRDFR